MSSANLVRVAFIPEVIYGETPVAGDFKTARFTQESLSGTPDTVESQQIRTDRQSSGQIVTGLQVQGDLTFEFAKEAAMDDFLASAMLNTWQTTPLVTTALTIDTADKTLERTTGSFITDGLAVGDFVTLGGFTSPFNNVQIMVAEIIDATTIRYVGPKKMVDGTGTTTTFKRADKLTIGTTQKSFSIEKKFLDMTNKAIIYRGMLVNTFELNVNYGELVGGSFGFVGNGHETVSAAADHITNARTILPPATTTTFNGSIDMPFIGNSAVGDLDDSGLKLQSVSLTLNNNETAQNVIGKIEADEFDPGTASIEVNLNTALKDVAWPLLTRKLDQTSFAIGFIVRNAGGWYAFYMPAVQVSFDDPASGGQNTTVALEMSGRAKVGDNQESALVIYRSN